MLCTQSWRDENTGGGTLGNFINAFPFFRALAYDNKIPLFIPFGNCHAAANNCMSSAWGNGTSLFSNL